MLLRCIEEFSVKMVEECMADSLFVGPFLGVCSVYFAALGKGTVESQIMV